MYDDVNVNLIPADATHIAAYADGRYENLAEIKKRFPKAVILKIDVRGSYRNGDVLDVEPGDATNSDAVVWFNARRGHTATPKPILYTSAGNVAALNATLQKAGIKRTDYFVWSAHYSGKKHICAPKNCGYPQADGTQWTDKSHGRSLDESLMEDYVFPKASKPAGPVKPKNTTNFTIQHTSLNVFDTASEQSSDAMKAFRLGKHVITGTEAYLPGLEAAAEKYNYWLYKNAMCDGWIAVKKTISAEQPKSGFIKILKSAKAIGDPHPYGPKGVLHSTFIHPKLGPMTIITAHYLTKCRAFGQSQKDNPKCPIDHRRANMELAAGIMKFADKMATKGNLVFFDADTNMITRTDDPFFGGDMQTCWKDTKKYPNTGHGNIDMIARHKKNKRVHPAHNAVCLEKLGLKSDHKTIWAAYYINNL